MYVTLIHSDLIKRAGRLEAFINKIKNDDYFLTAKGPVKIDKDQIYKGLKINVYQLHAAMDSRGFSITFNGKTDKNKRVQVSYPKEFFKTPEFGGKGVGSGVKAEDAAISQFKSALKKVMDETGLSYVTITINKRTANIVDVISTPGTPKSDFHLVDANGTEQFWISHKDGKTCKDFQQWGGLVELDKKFPNNEEIQNFVKCVQKDSGGILDGSKSYMREIKDEDLIKASVYGIDFKGKPGRQNVDILLQGAIKIVKKGNTYTLDSNHTMYHGELPKEGYKATFFVRKIGDRNQFGVKQSRFMVAPKALKRASTIYI